MNEASGYSDDSRFFKLVRYVATSSASWTESRRLGITVMF